MSSGRRSSETTVHHRLNCRSHPALSASFLTAIVVPHLPKAPRRDLREHDALLLRSQARGRRGHDEVHARQLLRARAGDRPAVRRDVVVGVGRADVEEDSVGRLVVGV